MFFSNIHILTVVVAAIVGEVVGFVWHAPWLFGKLWLKSKGWSDEHMHHKKAKQSMLAVHVGNFASVLVGAFILAALFNSLVVVSVSGILCVAVLVWFGFIVPVKLVDYLFGGDSLTFFFLTIGYWLALTVVMSLIIGLFS